MQSCVHYMLSSLLQTHEVPHMIPETFTMPETAVDMLTEADTLTPVATGKTMLTSPASALPSCNDRATERSSQGQSSAMLTYKHNIYHDHGQQYSCL